MGTVQRDCGRRALTDTAGVRPTPAISGNSEHSAHQLRHRETDNRLLMAVQTSAAARRPSAARACQPHQPLSPQPLTETRQPGVDGSHVVVCYIVRVILGDGSFPVPNA